MPPIVLFDGICNLCNGTIDFILDHESNDLLRFASLQSDAARALLIDVVGERNAVELLAGVAEGQRGPGSMLFVEDGVVHVRSTAALRIARHLRAPWRWLFALSVIPAFVRDGVYRFIAERRYRWFGKREACRVPTPELRARFLD